MIAAEPLRRTDPVDPDELLVLTDEDQLAALLAPERRRLVEELRREPDSAAGLARRLEASRQRLNLSHRDAWDRIVADDALGWPPVEREAFDVEPPMHFAAHVDDPADGLFRLSVERSSPEVDARDVVLWLQAWDGGERLAEIEAGWSALLEWTYPEGETP